jgi:hypothetical protein
MKTCSKCKVSKENIDFAKAGSWCKACKCEYAKAYREQNKELVKEKQKVWYNANIESRKEYRIRNKDAARDYEKQRYQTDANYRMRKVLRTRLFKTVKGIKTSKSMMQYLDTSISSFKEWIEYQWKQDMSWENYGSDWEIDHVYPCSLFDLTLEEDKQKCFHWSNMRPLLKKENGEKSNKINSQDMQNHENVVKLYLSLANGTK